MKIYIVHMFTEFYDYCTIRGDEIVEIFKNESDAIAYVKNYVDKFGFDKDVEIKEGEFYDVENEGGIVADNVQIYYLGHDVK